MLFGFLTEMDSGPTLDVFAVVIRNLPIVHKELIYMYLVSHDVYDSVLHKWGLLAIVKKEKKEL